MKGLLLKDFYMAMKYCRTYLLIAPAFIAISFLSEGNLFFIFYPCFLCGMIPVNLLGYDERSRWLQYSGTLPYTKAQIVSSKYLIGLIAQVTMFLIVGIVQVIRMNMNGIFRFEDFMVLMLMVFIMAMIFSSIGLPFIFKNGVEKGRLATYVMIVLLCIGSSIASALSGSDLQNTIQLNTFLLIFSIAGIGIYALSWYLSIVFYKKREIQ